MADATIKNIETITIKGAHNVTADVSGSNVTGLETIYVLKSVDADVTAAATTDVNVSGAKGNIIVNDGKNVVVNDATADKTIKVDGAAGTITVTDTKNAGTAALLNDITIDGGTDVTVTATGTTANGTAPVQSGKIEIGTITEATGDVKVTQNLNSDGKVTVAGGAITVTGGKTVTVDVNSTNSATDGTNAITTGLITVNGDANTTAVTVKQTEAVAPVTAVPATAGVTEVASVQFTDLPVGQTLILNGLTFTNTSGTILSAAEVAAAFANLKAGATHGQAKADKGNYTGTFTGDFTSGAVSADNKVVFTGTEAKAVADLAGTGTGAGTATVSKTIDGVDAVTAVTAVGAITNGRVVITDGATVDTIKTVTVDGYATTSTIASNALTDLTLKNSTANAAMTLTSTVASLNVTLDDINGTVDLDGTGLGVATLKTLNLTTTGEASDIILDAKAVETLTIAAAADLDLNNVGTTLTALKTATITGAGDVDLGNLSAVASFATLTASAATGDITATVSGVNTAVTTGSGNDSIVVTTSTGNVIKAIDLGAGNDTLNLNAFNTLNASTAAIAGGEGTDTIVLAAANAASFSSLANSAIFNSKVTGFEQLEIGSSSGDTVDLGNLGFNHVITNGTSAGILTLDKIANNGTVVLTKTQAGTTTVNVKDATLAASTADVLNVALENSNTNKSVYTIDLTGATSAAAGETLTVGGVTLIAATLGTETDVQLATLAATVPTITINGILYNKSVSGAVVTLTSANPVIAPDASLAIGGTIGAGVGGTAVSPTTTELSTAANLDVGTLTVANVETINISTSDLITDVVSAVDTITLTLAAVDATTINVTGDSDLILLNSGNTKVTSIDASDLTGDLTVTSYNTTTSATIQGGSGNDNITAANLDKVFGGAGNDTLVAGDLAELTGGTGADTFEAKTATTKNSYATIKDFNKAEGDSIKFANATDFQNTKVTLASTIGFEEYLDKAASIAGGGNGTSVGTIANGVSWFTYTDLETGTNTYLVHNVGAADATFTAGTDKVIKVTGVVDFSTASLNLDGTIAFA